MPALPRGECGGRGPGADARRGARPRAAAPAPTDAVLDAHRLLAALPEAQRSAVILRYYHDLPEEEVAAILGCPRGTVKSRLHHAMRRLLEMARP